MSSQSSQIISRVRELYGRALCVQALREAERLAPLPKWTWSAEARVLAGRLAANLGAPGLANAMFYRAWKEHPDDPDAMYFYSRVLLERRGPLSTWEFLKAGGDFSQAPTDTRADWYAQHAAVAIQFRDFDTAQAWIDRAQEIAPQRPWLWIERASLLESEDRYDQALAAARKALELRPGYRPAIQAQAHILQLLDRDEEALALLVNAAATTESSPIVLQLAMLQKELERYDDAQASLELCERYSPLMEKGMRKWIDTRRSDIACARGMLDEAIDYAKRGDHPFHKKIVENLSSPENRLGRQVLLPVGFVRQHHLTCAPATLTAISGFWSMPADHLAVVEAICYDGTPRHSERNWAETNGWVTREFTVTWEAAVALIDRGVPFTFTTVEPDSAHLQAVVGYDSRRRTLLLRDPYIYYVTEMLGDGALERYRSTGPRGMAMVPADKAQVLEGLELRDAKLWDYLNMVQAALARHDRDSAVALCEQAQALAPGHMLTITARRSLAGYDGNTVATLACFDELLGLFPDDVNLLLGKISCLRSLGRQQEFMQMLQDLCRKPGSDPLFWQMYAAELGRDARQHKTAERLLRRTLRLRRGDASSYSLLGNILWERGRREEAAELYRFSACLADKHEHLARAFFVAAQHLGQRSGALAHLQARFQRLGKRSSLPIRTLFWAMEELGQAEDAFDLLDQAISLRPDDGELLLFAASVNGRYGRFEQADALLERAGGRCSGNAFLRSKAELADLRGDSSAARTQWNELCLAQPLDIDAQGRLARLIAETESPAAAIAQLRGACDRFPNNYGLRQLLLGWLRDQCPPEDAEPVVRELVSQFPEDVWARRELAITRMRRQQNLEALAELQTALRIDPSDSNTHTLIGRTHLALLQMQEAREAFREAIVRSVDTDYAIAGLTEACDTIEQKREALRFVRDELKRQTIFGGALMAYRERAAELAEPQELLDILREALAARPDLWQAHSAVIQQLVAFNQLDEARDVALAATEAFPLMPQLWLDLAQVSRLRNDRDSELAALEHAVRISPGYDYAVRELAGTHLHHGNVQKARELLERAIARGPLDAFNHGCLADVLFRQGHKQQAIDAARKAVRLHPGYQWAWDVLRYWCNELNQLHQVEEVARELVAARPGEARSWLILAENLPEPRLDERLEALDKAIALSPRSVESYELKAHLLTAAGRIDEALAVCQPPALSGRGQTPVQLQCRSAIILWNSGKQDDAIKRMRDVLKEAPNYYHAWLSLAEWYRSREDRPHYLETTREWTRLFPHDTKALGFHGEACERSDRKDEAKQAYAKAARLSPGHGFAVFSLFDLQLQDKELDAAAATLAASADQLDPDLLAVRQIQLACRKRDLDQARRGLTELCMLPTIRPQVIEQSIEAMVVAGLGDQIDPLLLEASDRKGVNPMVGEAMMSRRIKHGGYKAGSKLLIQLQRQGDVCAAAARTLVETAAEAGETVFVTRLIRKYSKALSARDDAWGAVSFAYTTLRLNQKCIRWMRDYRDRPGATPWMLSNLIMCQRRLGQDQQSIPVIEYARSLPPDMTANRINIWHAIDLAIAGQTAASLRLLDSINTAPLDEYWRFLHRMARAQCIAATVEGPNREQTLPQVRELIEASEFNAPGWGARPELSRYRHLVLRTLRRRLGWFGAPGWCWKRLLGSQGVAPKQNGTQVSSVVLGWAIFVIIIVILNAARSR